MIEFTYWYMLPISIIIAAIATSAGIGGAIFFSPIFLLFLKIKPQVAIGTALITEIFGFGSGLLAYIKRKLINYRIGNFLFFITIPVVILGSYLSNIIKPTTLIIILGILIIAIGIRFLIPDKVTKTDKNFKNGLIIPAIGSLFMGMTSIGLGELDEYYFIYKLKLPIKVAVATSVYVLSITVLVASISHIIGFFSIGDLKVFDQIISLVIFTIPGVIIGGQIGPKLINTISANKLRKYLSFIFLIIGAMLFLSIK